MKLPSLFTAAAGLLAGLVLMVPAGAPAATSTYTITDLGSLGYGVTRSLAINANGQVTGYSYTAAEFQITCPPRQYDQQKKCFEHPYHAFLWSNGTMTDLGTLGGHFSKGLSINLSGEVVGSADKTTGSDSFLWNGKSMVDIGAVGASGINDSGQIAATCGPNPGEHACLDSNGKSTQLPNPTTFAAGDCSGSSINSSGEIIGNCDDTSSDLHAVLWQNGLPTDLGTLGGPQASAAAINNLGQVVGWAQTNSDADHGFLWSNGKLTDLGLNFFPAAVNDKGAVVGGNEIYSNGALRDLDTLIPAGSPYQIAYATGINDNGQIVADAYDTTTYQLHALVLNPS
jgi:probable HAF family extracellular repeat protein